MNSLENIIKRCKCGVYLTVNQNRDVYETVEQRIDEINERDFDNNGGHENYEVEIDDELKARLIKTDCIYELQFYPNTPIGFYIVYGENLEEVITKAEDIFKELNI